jgi:hypothetical protein
LAGAVDDTERRVAGAGQLGSRLNKPLQHCVERELRGDGDARVEQCAQTMLGFFHATKANSRQAAYVLPAMKRRLRRELRHPRIENRGSAAKRPGDAHDEGSPRAL